MTTVREATFQMLRERGMTTIFGNPGSTELPMLAEPDRPLVCVLGEGSAQYAITGFWTAAAYGLPVTFLVLNNSEYSILKWFAGLESVEGAPGLDLPALDCAAVAQSYGVRSERAGSRDELHTALSGAIEAAEPRLVEVAVQPGMSIG